MKHLIVIMCLATPALADCPPVPDILAEEARLLAQARVAPNERAAQGISNKLWALWAKAPDEKAQEMLDRGMAARRVADYASAWDAFEALIRYCPDYAEGYNQRAFVAFLRGDYAAALPDLDLAIARSPNHVAAIAGKALTLMGLKQDREAQKVLREALALNPWLSERRFLRDPEARDL